MHPSTFEYLIPTDEQLDAMARVLRELVATGQTLSCTFVGDGSLLDQVRHELQTVPNMDFSGAQNSETVERILINADAVLLPSLTDLCPIVMEALGLW